MKRKLLYCAIALTPAMSLAQPDHSLRIDVIEVVAKQPSTDVTSETLQSEALVTKPTHDAGALMRSVNGMTATRRGGLGFEPIIRGMSQSQLNVISNGAYSYGACPGRMDPPSTYVGFDSFDQVSVIKGNRSVIYGAGGSGGTLIFEHQRPDLINRSFTGKVTGSSTSNSNLNTMSADVAFGNERTFVRMFGELSESDNYEDGNGQTVSSAFESEDIGFIIGSYLSPADYFEISLERGNEDDVLYAGNGMDAPFADSTSMRLRWEHTDPIGFIDELKLNLYQTDIEHLMDNYTQRSRNMMPNGMAATSASDTWGGSLLALAQSGDMVWRFGADYRANDRSAILYQDRGKDGSYDMLVSLMWPEVEQRNTGVFAELDYLLSSWDTLRVGVRYDHFTSDARTATEMAGMMGSAQPAKLYNNFYGVQDGSADNNAIGVVLGWDRQFENSNLLSVNLSRSVRTPDATENFMARSAMGSFWVGNPDIDPEIHNQLDVTYMAQTGLVDWSATVFWDEIDDYIDRYIVTGANLYRNQNASIRGVELEARHDLTNSLTAQAAVSYARGDGDNGDLARISPLEARFILDYERPQWGVGAEMIASARQTHINYFVDVPEDTAGFGIVNFYGHWDAVNNLTVEAGVENVFDKAYAYHVNTAATDPFDPTAVRVFEPGRQVWMKMRYSF